MFLHIRLLTESFFTHMTGIRTLGSMDKLVCLHAILVTERFITHITGITMLARIQTVLSTYMLMFISRTLLGGETTFL